MRILVTGGAGFIGSNVADAFLAAGHEVAVLDNLSTGLAANLSPQARFYQVNLRDHAGVEQVIADFQPQIVDHHAAQIDVRKSTEDPIFDAETNILGSLNLLQSCLRHKIEKVIYASTGGAVYGEPRYLPADEEHPAQPIAEYGISKHTVEHYLTAYGLNYGLNYTILRYANVYGPRQNVHGEAGVIAIFTGRMLQGLPVTIYGTGEAVRDYVFVGDVARANLIALTRGDREIINIATGAGTSVNTLFHLLADATGYPLAPNYAAARVGEIDCTYLDPTRAGKVLDWQPGMSIAAGIARTVDYVRRHE